MDRWTDGWKDGRMDGRTDERTDQRSIELETELREVPRAMKALEKGNFYIGQPEIEPFPGSRCVEFLSPDGR